MIEEMSISLTLSNVWRIYFKNVYKSFELFLVSLK